MYYLKPDVLSFPYLILSHILDLSASLTIVVFYPYYQTITILLVETTITTLLTQVQGFHRL